MGKKYVIDRRTLPYDAFVPDESWLIPMDEEGGDSMTPMRTPVSVCPAA